MTTTKRLSLLLILAATLALAVIAAAQSISSVQSLDGAWNVSVQFADPGFPPCAPAGTVATSAGPGYGTLIAESCYASEGAGYGSWVRTGPNQFSTTFIGNSFDPSGIVASTYKVRAHVSLGPTRNTFSGPFTTEFFDLNGNPLGSPVGGTVSGVRIEAEP
jgi:hypothetical protein